MIYWTVVAFLLAVGVAWDWRRGEMSLVSLALILPVLAVVSTALFWAVAVRDVVTGGITR